eukprot:COSAG02_NODE_1366_length_13032_cov_721.428207_1_plen_58_part_00
MHTSLLLGDNVITSLCRRKPSERKGNTNGGVPVQQRRNTLAHPQTGIVTSEASRFLQ